MSTFQNTRPFNIELFINDQSYLINANDEINLNHPRPRKIFVNQKFGGKSNCLVFTENEANLFDFEIVKGKTFTLKGFLVPLIFNLMISLSFYKTEKYILLVIFFILFITSEILKFYYKTEIIMKKVRSNTLVAVCMFLLAFLA